MSTRIPNLPQSERAAADWSTWAGELPPLDQLWRRETGEVVTDHRSSWVRRLPSERLQVFIKTYEYATWGSRLRALQRTAPWATPRPVREFDALVWLQDHGFPGPKPLAALVWRQRGFVLRSTLVTTALPATAASELLPTLSTARRIEVAEAIGGTVARLHRLGWRDRNLDLRNLLITPTADGWLVAKIDSPRFVLRRAGPRDDRLTRADWRRLAPQLAALGLDGAARRAAAGA